MQQRGDVFAIDREIFEQLEHRDGFGNPRMNGVRAVDALDPLDAFDHMTEGFLNVVPEGVVEDRRRRQSAGGLIGQQRLAGRRPL